MNEAFRIGELAARSGVSAKTIRHYERAGLLPEPERSPAGHRLYRPEDERRLAFVLKAKRLGLTLRETRDLLGAWDAGERPCAQVLDFAERKLGEIDEEMRLLLELRHSLEGVLERGARAPVCREGICRLIEEASAAP